MTVFELCPTNNCWHFISDSYFESCGCSEKRTIGLENAVELDNSAVSQKKHSHHHRRQCDQIGAFLKDHKCKLPYKNNKKIGDFLD